MLPVAALGIVLGLGVHWWRTEQTERALVYRQADAALESGDYDTAALNFGALGGYRDARDRLNDVRAAADPAWQALDDASTAIEAGEYAAGIELLEAIVAQAPAFGPAQTMLESARATHIDRLTQEIAVAEANGDWWTAELALRELVGLQPDDRLLEERLIVLVREHAPITFVRSGAVFIAGPDGNDERALTPAMGALFPSWSPDRTQIAFIAVAEGEGPMRGSLMLMNGDGSELQAIVEDVLTASWPVWSPNGRGIAYSSVRAFDTDTLSGAISLNMFEVETGIERNLTGDQLPHAVLPSWSPDSEQIVFVSNLIQHRNGGGIDPLDGDIYMVPANGGPVTDVTRGRIFDDWWVQWSPSGERLLILTAPGDWAAPAKSRLFLFDLDGDELEEIPVDEWQLSLPFWSPDGEKIAYVTGGDTVNIWSDHGVQTLALDSDVLSFAAWSPDGRDLLVPSATSATPSYIVHTDGSVSAFELGFSSMTGANGPPIWGGITPSAQL